MAVCGAIASLAPSASAVITFGGAGNDTSAAPGNVGNYEGIFNTSFTGTAISPTFLATATHLTPGPTSQFVFNNGTSTSTTYNIQLGATLDDLALWQISPNQAATFSSIAPLYTGNTEVGASVVATGRGYVRGNAIPGGWGWAGGQSGPLSWGTNTIASIDSDTQLNTGGSLGGDFLQFNFANQDSSSSTYNPNEAIITPGDSGGGLFVNVNGQYQLAGINSIVDGVTDSTGAAVSGSLYDTNGYFNSSSGVPQLITTHASENSYATRISSKQNFIGLVDGTIPAASAASYPINTDGLLAVYSNLTLGAITGGGSLQVGSNMVAAKLQIAPNSGTSEVSGLSVYRTSTLDITNNAIIIDGGANPGTEAWIIKRLATGYNGGLWNGPGIDSSTAAANPGRYGIGFVTASDPGVTGLKPGQLEIAFTLNGDVNLDGMVNGSDFAIMATNLNKAAPDGWADGDFTYSGSVNGSDLALFYSNFNSGIDLQISTANLLALNSLITSRGLVQNVPEPSTLTAFTLCAASAWTFRRRRKPQIP